MLMARLTEPFLLVAVAVALPASWHVFRLVGILPFAEFDNEKRLGSCEWRSGALDDEVVEPLDAVAGGLLPPLVGELALCDVKRLATGVFCGASDRHGREEVNKGYFNRSVLGLGHIVSDNPFFYLVASIFDLPDLFGLVVLSILIILVLTLVVEVNLSFVSIEVEVLSFADIEGDAVPRVNEHVDITT